MLIKDCREVIKVGDWVRTNGSGETTTEFFEGEIGEIQSNRFFVWHNIESKNGGQGFIFPSTKGYSNSWEIHFNNPTAEIEILKPSIEIEILKPSCEIEKSYKREIQKVMSTILLFIIIAAARANRD